MNIKNFKSIIKTSKNVLIKNGKHLPQMLAYGSESNTIMIFADMPSDFPEKLKMIFNAGAKLAIENLKDNKIGTLEEIYFISEAWMVTSKKDEEPTLPLRNHPDKKEVLIIVGQNIKEQDIVSSIFEIKRNKKEKIIGFDIEVEKKEIKKLSSKKTIKTSESPLTNSFLEGYKRMTQYLETTN